MRVAVLFSGGKDSTYTIWLLQHQAWDVPVLLTVNTPESDSLLFHHPSVIWTKLQAKAMALEHSTLDVRAGVSEGLEDLEKRLFELKAEYGLEGLATGAVASDYQRTRFDRICDRVGLRSYSPLWHKKPRTIIDELIEGDFKVMITGVAARGLDESWLGRSLGADEWAELEKTATRNGIHLTGEGGEYESFVTDGPNFDKSVVVKRSRTTWDGQSGQLIIDEASLADKLRD